MKNTVIAIASNKMGAGDDALGNRLMESFIFALAQSEDLPAAVVFYNTGALLTTGGSSCLADIMTLENAGVEILTCGTCLKHFDAEDKLKAGTQTNMYTILEKQMKADKVIRP
jgi:selenium metabolism protein YedF